MKKNISLILSVICLISCVQEFESTIDDEKTPVVEQEIESTVIKARISTETDTRTTISDDTGANGSRVKISWSNYDYINVKIEDDSYTFAFKGYEEDESSAIFQCSSALPELTNGMKLTAEYPSTGKPDLSEQYGTLQNLSTYHYMTAEYTVNDEALSWEDVCLSFKTQTPIMKLTLRNEAFKGQLIKDLCLKINNDVSVSSLNYYSGSEDTGEAIIYFAIEPQQIDNNTSITAICNDVTYEATISASTMLQAGKLYRVNKTMEVADLIMTYEEGKAIITVFNEVAAEAVTNKIEEALSDGYTDIVIEGTISDTARQDVNELMTDTPYNTVLTIDNRATFYVCNEEGFRAWGEEAQNHRRANCTLIDDINLTKDWTFTIGTSSTSYDGTFEGNGHIISGLRIDMNAVYAEYHSPLAMISHFGGIIRNVIIKGGSCKYTGEISTIRSALLIGFNYGTVENITLGHNVDGEYISFDLTSSSDSRCFVDLGAIVSISTGIIKNCTNKLPISISVPEDSHLRVGGIVGINYDNLLQCINEGDIDVTGGTDYYVGGIAGECTGNEWREGNVFLCANTGEINSERDGKGGIIGWSFYSSCIFAGCYTTYGDIVDKLDTGNIDNCYSMDHSLVNEWYIFKGTYVDSVNQYCDEMNEAVAKYECEYIDKEWRSGDGYPNLRNK